jgi:hypothetical protein
MPKFNVFRASFDGSIPTRERNLARVAAGVFTATAIIGFSVGALALLHGSSDKFGEIANTQPAPERNVRVLGTETAADKSCDDQTWPYIDAKCLKIADPKTAADRTTPKHGLAAQTVTLQSAVTSPKAAPPSAPADITASTTGSAPPAEADNERAEAAPTRQQATLPTPPPFASTGRQRQDAEIPPVQSRSEQRRLKKEARSEQRRLEKEQRQNAKRERAQRREARVAEDRAIKERRVTDRRAKRKNDRIVRRWTEYTYRSPAGGSRRVIVIRRGSMDDDFFRTIR